MINKKLGYYTVDNLQFDSKIQACLFANKFNKEITWHFNQEVFSKFPWHIEPTETLDELYDERSRNLREKYDYVMISYSGGADSHNIVESFIRQGLHIDEIVVNTMTQANKKFTDLNPTNVKASNAAAEHVLQTIPRLKEIQNKIPKTKITVLDLSDYLLNYWLEVGDARWVLDKREGLNPLNVTRFNYIHFSEVRKNFDRNKKIALILGVEKPRTLINQDNDLYISFTDRATNIVTVAEHIKEYSNSTVEFFYWSPDSVRMICKQAHVIKRWLELDVRRRKLWHIDYFTNIIYRTVHERVLRTILYTTWNDNWYQADKATKDWYSEFDEWFIYGFSDTPQHRVWLEGIKYIQENTSKFVREDDGVKDGLFVFSHHYFIDHLKSPPLV
jgi:hypothetical protein